MSSVAQVENFVNPTRYNIGSVLQQPATSQDIEGLEDIIGTRIPEQLRYDHVNNQHVAYDDLTKVLIDKAPRAVGSYVTGLLTEGYVSPYTTYLLPISVRPMGEANHVVWTNIHYAEGLAPQIESEGVPPIFTHNESSHSAPLIRRGAGIKIEATFFRTPEGRKRWIDKIKQLAAIVQRTNEFGVMVTILKSPWINDRQANQLGGPTNMYGDPHDMTFEDRLDMEIQMFGLVNKVPDSRGFMNLVSSILTNMKMNDVTPDAMIVPPHMMQTLYATKPDLYEYQSAGPAVTENRRKAFEVSSTTTFTDKSFMGLSVIDGTLMRDIKGSRNSVTDLLSVHSQIGEFYPVETDFVFPDVNDFDHYKTSDRNIRIFNERYHRMSVVDFKSMIENCLRWDSNGNLHPEYHDGIREDMFIGNDGEVVNTWGQIGYKYIPSKYHSRVIRTVLNKMDSEDRKKFRDFMMKFEEINDESISNITSFTGVTMERDSAEGAQLVAKLTDNIKSFVANNVVKFLQSIFAAPGVSINLDDKMSDKYSDNEDAKDSLRQRPMYEQVILDFWFSTPINKRSLLTMADNNIYIPVNFILFRPYMEYITSTLVIMKSGVETGETCISHQYFNMGVNVADSTVQGSFLYRAGHYVKQKQNIAVAPNVFIQRYVKGNDTSFINFNDFEELQQNGGLKRSTNSILCYMIPPTSNVIEHNVVDLRGTHPDLKPAGGFHDKFFENSEYYNSMIRIDQDDLDSPHDPMIDYEDEEYKCKSLCCLGHFEYGKRYAGTNHNTGHLGRNVYDGYDSSRIPGMYSTIKHMTVNTIVQ